MKILLTILLTVWLLLCKGSTINISIFPCQTENADTFYTIAIFKDGQFLKTIGLSRRSNFDTTLVSIESGFYLFQFNNLYRQKTSDTLRVTKDTVYWKTICPDRYNFDLPFKSFIDSLKNFDTFTIQFESYGCYHWEKQTLKVYKSDNLYYAILSPVEKIRDDKILGRRRKIRLTEKQVRLISDFQEDTYKNATGYPGNTEITYYTFVFSGYEIKFVDSQEAGERFKTLINSLY